MMKKIELSQTVEKPKKMSEELESKLSDLIFEKKDCIKARNLYEEQKDTIEEDERIILKAKMLRYCHRIGDTTALHQLIKLANDKSNLKIDFELATRYEEMTEYRIAKDQFIDITKKLDLNNEDDVKFYLDCYIEAAFCLASDYQCDLASSLMSELLYKNEFEDHKAIILADLLKLAKDTCKDSDKLILYGELSLNFDPSNTFVRFNVAYEHAKLANNKLSLLHYKKLVHTDDSDAGGLNNLGVVYDKLKMSINSIENFYGAVELNSTLAMANLADSYLVAGFIDDGLKLINKANNLAKEDFEIHGQVGIVKSRIKNFVDSEKDKEKKILEEAEIERKFLVNRSKAFIIGDEVDTEKLNGLWNIESLDVQLYIVDSEFSVDNAFIKIDDSSDWSPLISVMINILKLRL